MPRKKPAAVNRADVRKPPRKPWSDLFDPAAIEIVKGVALPGRITSRAWAYRALLNRMQPGDHVKLQKRQADALKAFASKHGFAIALRKLDTNTIGVWRHADK